jgi:hypothetical protein
MKSRVGSTFDHNIVGNYNKRVGSNYGINVTGSLQARASTVAMHGTSNVGFKGGHFGIDAMDFIAKVGAFKVSSTGNFNGNVTSNLTDLNSYHMHTHQFMWYWSHPGGSSSSNTMPFGGAGVPTRGNPINVSPGSPSSISPQNPPSIIPDSAINDGGGITIESLKGDDAKGEESNSVSKNKTKVANRRNENRK